MNPLRQIIAVTVLGVMTLHTRLKASLTVVMGLAFVVAAMLFFLCAEAGMRAGYLGGLDPGRAIVTSLGAQTERASALPRAAATLIRDAPGIARAPDGASMAEPEFAVTVHLMKRNGADGYTVLEGWGPLGFALRPELKLVAGRDVRRGRRELIVGEAAREKFIGADIGGTVRLPDGLWPVVGIYSAPDMLDGNLVGDADTLMAALRRAQFSSVLVRLESPNAFTTFHDALAGNPALQVTPERDSDYWRRQFDDLPATAIVLGYVLGVLVGLGALTGTLQTMYGAVAARESEIAILRALGFGGLAVGVSIVLEAMLLAILGAAIGIAVIAHWWAGFAYNGAYGVMRITLTPGTCLIVIVWSLAIALMGALSPAIKASRVTVVEALRAY